MRFTAAILSIGLTRLTHSSAFAPVAINAASRSLSTTTSLSGGVLTDLVNAIDAPRITKVPAAAFSTAAPSPPTMPDITETEVRALFELWNQALATGDSRLVAHRYIKSPMLLPTVSDQPRTGKLIRLRCSVSVSCVYMLSSHEPYTTSHQYNARL